MDNAAAAPLAYGLSTDPRALPAAVITLEIVAKSVQAAGTGLAVLMWL